MVLILKAKERLEKDNPYQVGQSGLIGNPAATRACEGGDLLLLIGTDFPYRQWYPQGKTVIQIDARAEHIGRRIGVDVGLVGHCAPTLDALLAKVEPKGDDAHLRSSRDAYLAWAKRQGSLTDPDHDRGLIGKIRGHLHRTTHPSGTAGPGRQPTRRRERGVHHRYRHVHRVAVALRPDDR